jgi:hypothetical protein
LLLLLEQTRGAAVDHNVHRPPRMGAQVLINRIRYKSDLTRNRPIAETATPRYAALSLRWPAFLHAPPANLFGVTISAPPRKAGILMKPFAHGHIW